MFSIAYFFQSTNECQQENNIKLISKSSNSISSNITSIEEPPLKKRNLTELVIDAIEENSKKSDELINLIKELGCYIYLKSY